MTKLPHSPHAENNPQPRLRLLLAIGGDNTHRSPGPVYSLSLQSFLSVLLVIRCVSLLDRRRPGLAELESPRSERLRGLPLSFSPLLLFSEWLRELSRI